MNETITGNSFEVKDSGKRKEFASGMVRDVTTGKVLWHLVSSGPMLKRWAAHLTSGAAKYNEDNWMLANGEEELKRFKSSAFRHFMQWFRGDRDEDHGAAVIFNINGAEYVRDKLEEKKSNDSGSQHSKESRLEAARKEYSEALRERGGAESWVSAGVQEVSQSVPHQLAKEPSRAAIRGDSEYRHPLKASPRYID